MNLQPYVLTPRSFPIGIYILLLLIESEGIERFCSRFRGLFFCCLTHLREYFYVVDWLCEYLIVSLVLSLSSLSWASRYHSVSCGRHRFDCSSPESRRCSTLTLMGLASGASVDEKCLDKAGNHRAYSQYG